MKRKTVFQLQVKLLVAGMNGHVAGVSDDITLKKIDASVLRITVMYTLLMVAKEWVQGRVKTNAMFRVHNYNLCRWQDK